MANDASIQNQHPLDENRGGLRCLMKSIYRSIRMIHVSARILLCFTAVPLFCTCSNSENGSAYTEGGFGAAQNECTVTPEWYRTDINFDPAALAVVDQHAETGNILVRGSMPIHTAGGQTDYGLRKFTYDELNKGLQSKSNIPGFDLRDYQLIDISLIDDQHAGLDTFIPEVKSFGLTVCDLNDGNENRACWPPKSDCSPNWQWGKLWGSGYVETEPEPRPEGNFVWWPISACDGGGDLNHPTCSIPVNELLTEDRWNFSGLVDHLIGQMKVKSASGRRKVLYIHCSWGKDRTGALSAAYLLKKAKEENHNLTLKQAIQKGKDAVNLVPNDGYLRLTVVYCREMFPNDPGRCAVQ